MGIWGAEIERREGGRSVALLHRLAGLVILLDHHGSGDAVAAVAQSGRLPPLRHRGRRGPLGLLGLLGLLGRRSSLDHTQYTITIVLHPYRGLRGRGGRKNIEVMCEYRLEDSSLT